MTKIDLTDRKILHLLDQNSRVPFSVVAKKLGTSPQVVKYRVERLMKEGILISCWPMVEYRSLGYFFGLYFIKLHNMTPSRERELFLYLNQHVFIPIIMRGEGYADVIIAIDAKGIHHLNQIMIEFNTMFSECILDSDVVIPIGFSRFNRNYLVNKSELTTSVAFTGAPPEEVAFKLDSIDRKVLSFLNADARTQVIEIARKLRTTQDIVIGRIKKLEKLGVIQCYTILLDHVKVGWPRHRTLLKLKNLTEKKEKELFMYCNLHPNIVHHLKVLGNWNLVIDIEIESREKLREVLNELKQRFSEIIERVEPTYIYKIDRFRDVPIELPEINKNKK